MTGSSSTSSGSTSLPTPAPTASTTEEPVAEALDENTELVSRVCDEYEHLVSVGWSEKIAPGLMVGDVPDEEFAAELGLSVKKLEKSGLLPVVALLSKSDVAAIARLGAAREVAEEIVGRC